MRRLPVMVLALVVLCAPAGAQDPHPGLPAEEGPDTAAEENAPEENPDENNVAEIEALIATIQARVSALGQAGNQRDQSLEFLTQQVEKAIGDMAVQQDEKAGLLRQNADLNWQVEHLVDDRGELKEELLQVNTEHETSVADLRAELKDMTLLLAVEQDAKAELAGSNEDLQAKLDAAAGEREALNRARHEQKQQIGLLNRKIAVQQTELTSLSDALTSSERRIAEKEQDLAALQHRLESALATPVERLARFRTAFLGRLQEAVGAHEDMRIEGDHFVFQSEVLFAPGSAEIGEAGERRLAELARSLHDVSRDIPNDLDWVLRVDGHTDRQAADSPDYPSNWELSSARAVTVVRFLIRQGVPPYRLAATGFGEFQPLDADTDERAQRRNRRIEFKLTRK